jgi:hypothetical protein
MCYILTLLEDSDVISAFFSVSGKALNGYLSGNGKFVSGLVASHVLLLLSGQVLLLSPLTGTSSPCRNPGRCLNAFYKKNVSTSLYEESLGVAFDIELPSFTPVPCTSSLLWPLYCA